MEEPKRFLIVKGINKKPSYWGYSMGSAIILILILLIIVVTARGFVSFLLWTGVLGITAIVLNILDSKYKGLFFSKYLKYHIGRLNGTKIKISVIKNALNQSTSPERKENEKTKFQSV